MKYITPIFWHEHRQEPLATDFDIAYIEIAVAYHQFMVRMADALAIKSLTKLANELIKEHAVSRD